MPGSRRLTSAPRDRKSNAPVLGMFNAELIVQFNISVQTKPSEPVDGIRR
jgi:hypothetical protein